MDYKSYSSTPISPQVGQTVFSRLSLLVLFIICAVTPAITANAISEEKEKHTFDMLMATPLQPVTVLWGRLFASMSYVFLLIFAALPMASLVITYGGVTIRDMLKTVIMLLVIAVMIGMIGLFMSSLLGKSGRAVASTYISSCSWWLVRYSWLLVRGCSCRANRLGCFCFPVLLAP